MVLLEAHLYDGAASGHLQYSRVESRGQNTFRVEADVECVGLFRDGVEAVVAGPVTRVDGDVGGFVGTRDWWVLQIAEGGADGDLLLAERHPEARALDLCQGGPTGSAVIRAVDGDLSIY